MRKRLTIEDARSSVYQYAIFGVDACERFSQEDAVHYALLRFQQILGVLDRLDDTERSARICRIIGVELGVDGEPLVKDDKL